MTEDQQSVVNQQQLDRLAAGDVDADEAREIVGGLDHLPDGWKRCALALLEAQSWRRTFHGLVADSNSHHVYVAPQDPDKRSARSRVFRLAAIAALVAVALLGGISLGRHSVPLSPIAVEPQATGNDADSVVADHVPQTSAKQVSGVDETQNEKRLVGLLRIEDHSGAPCVVPVVLDTNHQGVFSHQPPLLSEYEQHLLATDGWQVQQDRKLLTVQLTDGGKLTIPVDEIKYRPIGRRVY
jgi:hypothetical protein